MLIFVAAGWAWTPQSGESLGYVAEWMGIEAGVATAVTREAPGGWTTTLTTRSAAWLEALYPIDDEVRSDWGAAGSVRYTTRFREGKFQQDQRMDFGGDGIHVSRSQLLDGAWKQWTNDYAASPGVEDPLSAVLRLRDTSSAVTLSVFSGKAVVPVVCAEPVAELVEGVAAWKVELRTRQEGVLRDRITAWFSADEERVPLRAVVHSRAGPVTVRLVERLAP